MYMKTSAESRVQAYQFIFVRGHLRGRGWVKLQSGFDLLGEAITSPDATPPELHPPEPMLQINSLKT